MCSIIKIIDDELEMRMVEQYADFCIRLFKQAVKEGKIRINIDVDEAMYTILHDKFALALMVIKGIIDSDLSDFECIEKITDVLSAVGLDKTDRHDFI